MKKNSGWRRVLRGLMWTLLGGLLLSIGSVLLMRWVDPFTSTFMLRDRVVALFSGDKDYRFAHQWVDQPRISRWMPQAVIAAEDQKFFEHHGFDFESMEKAWSANQRGRRIRGGSTISQQVAKNLFLWPGRSYVRKGLEAYFTVLIESLWPKQRILEVYVNSAEFGKGVFGVQAASQRFFHKNAAQLNSSEAALLAAVLPAPKRFRVDQPSNFVRSRQAWIQQQMGHLDPLKW